MGRQSQILGHFEKLERRIASSVGNEPPHFFSQLQVNEKHFRTDTLVRIAGLLEGEFRQGIREATFKVVDTDSRAWALIIRLKVRGPTIDLVEWKDAPEILIQGNKLHFSSVDKKGSNSPKTQHLAAVIENAPLTNLELKQDEIVLQTLEQVISLRKGCQGTTEIITRAHR